MRKVIISNGSKCAHLESTITKKNLRIDKSISVTMDEMETYLQRLIFQHNVREQIMFLLVFILLYLFSFILVFKCQRRYNEYSMMDEDEINVYYNIVWLCSVALAVAWLSGVMMPVRIDWKE